MQVVENAVVVCRSRGEKDVCIVENVNTGEQISLVNTKGIDLKAGMEGEVVYLEGEVNQLESFEAVMEEELV